MNELVLQGTPFREAYKKVGLDIEAGNFTASHEIHHTHEGSVGNLCNDKIEKMMAEVLDSFKFDKVNEAIARLLNGE